MPFFLTANETVTCTYFKNDDKADNRTNEETKRFVNRRVDNLLTYGPDRARMLRATRSRLRRNSKA